MKSTKKSLIASALSLVLCVSMLLGTTYAWFTDSVTSGKNRIVAGNLKVDLVMDKAANGEYVSIANEEGAIFGEGSIAQNNSAETLWEPGKTQIVYLGVKNAGNLAIKYNIILKVTDGGLASALEYAVIDGAKASDLASVPNWATIKASENAQTGNVAAGVMTTAQDGVLDEIAYDKTKTGETDYFALAVHMKEDAGNEYKGKDITIDVTVVAGQVAAEADSFNNQYDAEALYEQIPESGSGALVFDEGDNTVVKGLSEDFDGDTIILTEGITEIGPGAFAGHDEINYISLPSTLTKIGEGAFSGIGEFTAEINGDQEEMKNIIDFDWEDKSKVNMIFNGNVSTSSESVFNEEDGYYSPAHAFSSAGCNGRELTLEFKGDVTFNAQDFVNSKINKISFTGEDQVIKFNHQGFHYKTGAPITGPSQIIFNFCSGGNNIIEFHSLPAPDSEITPYLIDDGSDHFTINIACSETEWVEAGFTTQFATVPTHVTVNWNYNFD